MSRRAAAIFVVAAASGLSACESQPAVPVGETAAPAEPSGGAPVASPAADFAPERLRAVVRASYPHDPAAYTQGLLWHGGAVYESTGLTGRSTLRRWNLDSGEVDARIDLQADLFGEGLERVGGRLVQLTWRAGRALIYDLESLEPVGEHVYDGQGWGLCHDGRRLVMSDGSAELSFRDAETFAELGRVTVTLDGREVRYLNELECVDGTVWANVYQTEVIVGIDPESGRVTHAVDASGLLTPAERRNAEVLNGIAYRPETGTFLLTGKLWPRIFEVELVPAAP